jgi:hypothetical protein
MTVGRHPRFRRENEQAFAHSVKTVRGLPLRAFRKEPANAVRDNLSPS